jgi:hypothetical protein
MTRAGLQWMRRFAVCILGLSSWIWTMELSTCCMSEGHVRNIFDYVFHGQMLFIMSKEGKNLLKQFGSSEWEEF